MYDLVGLMNTVSDNKTNKQIFLGFLYWNESYKIFLTKIEKKIEEFVFE